MSLPPRQTRESRARVPRAYRHANEQDNNIGRLDRTWIERTDHLEGIVRRRHISGANEDMPNVMTNVAPDRSTIESF